MLLCPVLLYYKENSLLDVKSYRSKVFRTLLLSLKGTVETFESKVDGILDAPTTPVGDRIDITLRLSQIVPFQWSQPFRKSQIDRPLCSRAKKAISGYKLRIDLGVFKSEILYLPVFSKWAILMSHGP